MKRLFSSPILAALAVLCLVALAVAGLPGLLAVLPLCGLGVMLVAVSASKDRPAAPRRNLPHWLTVALYRVEAFAISTRNKLGAIFMAGMFRSGMALAAFPGSVTADIAFGIVGEWAFDGPQRAQPARINHGTAADIVIGRWFTLAADGTARPGGAGAVGGILLNPKNMASGGTAANGPLAPTMTLPTGTLAEFGYFGAVVVPCTTAAAIGQAAWYDTTTGVIGAGAPGGGQAAIPNSKFIRYANAAAGLAVLELTN